MSSSELSEWESEDDAPALQKPVFKSKTEEAEWERKQRSREYRVAARREKRNRKADEKKQRKLNATILRRMTKNPDKYNKNVDRNRRRDINLERRKIYIEAVQQAERLAAIHDPTGETFNVGPVVVQEDGRVVSLETLERRAQAQAAKAAKLAQGHDLSTNGSLQLANGDNYSHARTRPINAVTSSEVGTRRLSKNQQKKLAILEERPPPPKPMIPAGIDLPEGEENWLSLWDLSDDQLERRVMRERKCKAADRKALRLKQKEGKAERRAARDERRRVYREKKLEWRAIKEAEKQQKRKLLRVEQEEAKRIEVEVNLVERQRALEACAKLGFTLSNVEGVDDIEPKALGMKGQEIDFDILEIGERPSELKIKGGRSAKELNVNASKSNRVDLGRVIDESKVKSVASNSATPLGLDGDFVSLEFGNGLVDAQEHHEVAYNHKLRRKLHRAIEAAQIQKELLVRSKAKEHCETNNIEVPPELIEEYKPIKLSGRRILEDGTLETEKQERVRKRLELAEYNKAAKILRQQAKAEAIEAGLRVYAELTGQKAKAVHNIAQTPTENHKLPTDYTYNTNTQESLSQDQVSCKRHRDNDDETDGKKSKKSKTLSTATDNFSNTEYRSVEVEVKEVKEVKKVKKVKRLDAFQESKSLEMSTIDPGESKVGAEKRNPIQLIEKSNNTPIFTQDDEGALKKTKRYKKRHDQEEDEKLREACQGHETNLGKKPKKTKTEKIEGSLLISIPGSDKSKKHHSKGGNMKEGRFEGETNDGEQWNVDALDGDATRKGKFLRLLGASKANGIDKRSVKVEAKLPNLVKVEDELERQFQAGVRMKHDSQGKRRGLGA